MDSKLVKTLKRIFSFFVRNSLDNPFFVLQYFYFYFISGSTHIKIIEEKDLFKSIESGKSLIRLGDGETYIMQGGSIPGNQNYDHKLKTGLLKIITTYTSKSPYILGIATDYLSLPSSELKRRKMRKIWSPSKLLFFKKFNKRESYFNAHFFYKSNSFKEALTTQLKSSKVLVVANEEQMEALKKTTFVQDFCPTFLESPGSNGFSFKDDIYKKIVSVVQDDKKYWRVILSIGPTSKVLAYELSHEGIVCYDVGQGISVIYSDIGLDKDLK